MFVLYGRAARSVIGAVVVAAIALTSFVAAASPAQAAGISFTVTVRSNTNALLKTGCLVATNSAGKKFQDCTVSSAGAYSLTGLATATYTLRLTSFEGYIDRTIGAKSSSYTSTVRLSRIGVIDGKFVDEHGAPIAGAPLTLLKWPSADEVATVLTDANGNFRFEVTKSSNFAVRFGLHPGFGTAIVGTGNAGPDESSAFGTVTLAHAGAISGTLALPSDISGDTACVGAWPTGSWPKVASTCGPVGSPFQLSDLRPGNYDLCVWATTAPVQCQTSVVGVSAMVGTDAWTRFAPPVTVVSGGTVTNAVTWGGTLKVNIPLDNGDTIADGCLTATAAAIGEPVTDCSPVDGGFSLHLGSDLELNQLNLAIQGASNAADSSWTVNEILNKGGTVSVSHPMHAIGTSSVTVNLARDDASALSGGCVALYLRSPSLTFLKNDCSITDGVATFDSLAHGQYAVVASDVPGTFAAWWYPAAGASSGSGAITLGDDDDEVLAFSLPTTQTLRGIVTNPSGTPQGGGTVTFSSGSVDYASAVPGGDGTFELVTPIVVGGLKLTGFAGTFDSWANYKPSHDTAAKYGGPQGTPITQDIAVHTAPQAHIVGTIAAPPSLGTEDICVYAITGTGATAAPGVCGDVGDAFSIPVLPFNDYGLCVHAGSTTTPCAGDPSTWEDFGGTSRIPVTVSHGGDTAVTLAFGGKVRVVVTAPGASWPLEGGCADLSFGGATVATSCDDTAGVFEFDLDEDYSWSGANLVSVTGVHGANDVVSGSYAWSVGGGLTTTVNLQAWRWWAVSGTIVRPAGFEDTHACVMAMQEGVPAGSTCLEPGDSTYTLPLANGTYRLQFYTEEPGVAVSWHHNSDSQGTSTPLVVDNDDQTASATLKAAGHVGGTVTDADGDPAVGGCVSAVGDDGWTVDFKCPGADGTFAFESLPPGGYRFEFADFDGAANTWFGPAVDYGNAQRVVVAAGTSVVVDQQLARPAFVTGKVTRGGVSASGGCVYAVSEDGFDIAKTCDIVDGVYSFSNLPSAHLTMRFQGFDGAATLWSGGSATFAHAAWLTLSAGNHRTVNIDLPATSTVSGKSWDVGEVTVELRTLDGDWVASQALTELAPSSSEGTFSFGGVPPGKYNVKFIVDATGVGVFARESGLLTPLTVTIPATGGAAITGVSPPTPPTSFAEFRGSLNVPASWKSSTVCVLAYAPAYSYHVTAAACGKRGDDFELSWPESKDVVILFTNGRVRSNTEYKAFKGTKRYYGNTSSIHETPYYSVPPDTWYYLPVWFYGDVTFKTTNFDAIQWFGAENIYRPSANTFRPDSTMTRRDFAIYLYKAAGSPAVALPSKSPFADVKTTDAGYKALLWLRSTKVWTSATFKPSAGLDKKTEALILYRAAGSPSVTLPSKNPYKDIKSSDSAYKAVTWANKYKIVTKSSTTSFGATSLVKRKYAAASLYAWWWL